MHSYEALAEEAKAKKNPTKNIVNMIFMKIFCFTVKNSNPRNGAICVIGLTFKSLGYSELNQSLSPYTIFSSESALLHCTLYTLVLQQLHEECVIVFHKFYSQFMK